MNGNKNLTCITYYTDIIPSVQSEVLEMSIVSSISLIPSYTFLVFLTFTLLLRTCLHT